MVITILDLNTSNDIADILEGQDRFLNGDENTGNDLIKTSADIAYKTGLAISPQRTPRKNLKSHELLDISYQLFGKL